jgi:hypothetical protein
VYQEAAQADGVCLKEGTHGARDFSIRTLPGTYRRILYKPDDLTWRLLAYRDPDQDLVPSDVTVALNRPTPEPLQITPGVLLLPAVSTAINLRRSSRSQVYCVRTSV